MPKKKHPINRRAPEQDFQTSLHWEYDWLRVHESPTSAEEGRLLYEYGNTCDFAELSPRKKRAARRSVHGLVPPVFAGLLVAWFLASLIYGLVAEQNTRQVLLHHLVSFFVTAVAVTILLASWLGLWGKLIRIASGRRKGVIVAEEAQRDPFEAGLVVTERVVILFLNGAKYALEKEKCDITVHREDGGLALTLKIGDDTLKFPRLLPLEDYPALKSACRERITLLRRAASAEKQYDKKGRRLYAGYSLGNVIVSAFFALLVLGAGAALIALSCLKVIDFPAFPGVFFLGCGLLALCNTFQHLPAVNTAGLPTVFGLILAVVPLWFLVWVETEVLGVAFTPLWLLTHAEPQAVGCVFLAGMGVYALSYGIYRLILTLRFGN